MKTANLLSLVAAGMMAAALPVMAAPYSNSGAMQEPYRPDVGAAYNGNTMAMRQLPPPVRRTLRQQFPNDAIKNVSKEWRQGQPAYRIEFSRRNNTRPHPELLVAANGQVLSEHHMGNAINEPAGANIPVNR